MNLKNLTKFLSGKSSHQEAQEIASWIHSDEAEITIGDALQKNKSDEVEIESERVYESILDGVRKLEAEENTLVVNFLRVNHKMSRFRRFYGVAAAIVLFMTAYFGLYNLDDLESKENTLIKDPIVKITDKGQKLSFRLTDGTIVKLNANSSLSYDFSDPNGIRKVRLTGEAFFDVARDKSRPFIIQTDELEVSVLGTSFNVNTSRENRLVAVKSGKVKVRSVSNGDMVFLQKSEFTSLNDDKTLSNQPIADQEDLFGWVDNKLVFSADEITEVTWKISQWFDCEIDLRVDIKGLDRYTAVHNNPTLKEVLESFSHAYQLKYEIDGKKITLK
ncbi:MAG: FecR family protein [Cyclobacteriaceae bacterium]|uniref:FecR family protein n=1 Tax=Reichenbachiella sp. TaxID=2184521 RepID=UPI0032663ED2